MTVSDLLVHSKRSLFSSSSGIRLIVSPTREMSNMCKTNEETNKSYMKLVVGHNSGEK